MNKIFKTFITIKPNITITQAYIDLLVNMFQKYSDERRVFFTSTSSNNHLVLKYSWEGTMENAREIQQKLEQNHAIADITTIIHERFQEGKDNNILEYLDPSEQVDGLDVLFGLADYK